MTIIGWIQILLYCAIVVALVKPLGAYMTHVFNGERTWLSPVLRPVERAIYWAGGVDETREQSWLMYAVGMLLFHVGGFLILYALLRFQALLPFNPAGQSAVAEDLSFNTAASFQARFTASPIPVFIPWPPTGLWMWAASPSRNARPFRKLCVTL